MPAPHWSQCPAVESELYDGLTREQVEAVLNFAARSLEATKPDLAK